MGSSARTTRHRSAGLALESRPRVGGAIDPVAVFRDSRYRQCKASVRPQDLTGKSDMVFSELTLNELNTASGLATLQKYRRS